MSNYLIPLPLRVPISKKKFFPLNLNQYRNTHFRVLHKAKKTFGDIIAPVVADLMEPIRSCETLYTIFPKTRRMFDLDNVGAIVSKFFHDVLVNTKILEDDNYKFVTGVAFRFGGIDKENPRAEVYIHNIKRN